MIVGKQGKSNPLLAISADGSILPEALLDKASGYHLTTEAEVRAMIRPRDVFSHKGTYGHALFVGGSRGKMGAAVLASRACLRAGAGLLTAYVPGCGYEIMQVAVPEAMCLTDSAVDHLALLPDALRAYAAIGAGCGMGLHEDGVGVLAELLRAEKPTVLDADAINMLAYNKMLLDGLPAGAILTPHPKEFERLCGACGSRREQVERAQKLCCERGVYVVLKGAFTAVVCPRGDVFFNPTGNPGMATAGSGDVLCGIILGLLAQGYSPLQSAVVGAYAHGAAGDRAAQRRSQSALIASDIVENLAI